MSEAREIVWNIINAAIAGTFVFFGAFADGTITNTELIASIGTSVIVGLIKFRDYWMTQENEYKNECKTPKAFEFI